MSVCRLVVIQHKPGRPAIFNAALEPPLPLPARMCCPVILELPAFFARLSTRIGNLGKVADYAD
jgi:hypothetical protein